jgi:hypothetical protein
MPRVSGYWARHYTFGSKKHKEKAFLIGRNRAADIVINVILPVAFAYTRRSQDEELQQIAMAEYAEHRKLQDNKITRYVARQILRDKQDHRCVINSAMRQQGLIHIYKSFCATRDCRNCPFMLENL